MPVSTASNSVEDSYFSRALPNGRFPDPFLDMATLTMPSSLVRVLNLAEGLWLKNGTMRMAMGRIARYFITDIEFKGQNDDQVQNLRFFLDHRLRVTPTLALLGDDYLCYGNSFSSIVLPFRRYLRCKNCRSAELPIYQAEWKMDSELNFTAHCSKCRRKTPHVHIDRRSTEEDKVKVRRWSPHEIRLECHPHSQAYRYYWKIPGDIKNEVMKGNPFMIETMPWEVIETVKCNQLFRFAPDVIYHMKEETLAGMKMRGWGSPRIITNFAQAWYVQVLKRFNEALAMDYVMPFRAISPPRQNRNLQAGGTDPITTLDYGDFTSKVKSMVAEHRIDPARWHVMPYPIEYQSLGGEAKDMAPRELIDQGQDDLLNASGIPANLYRFDLQMQVLPTALRLFQQSWPQLIHEYNGWLEWAVGIVCTAMNWDKPESVAMKPVTLADDIELRQVMLQLSAANLISRNTAFGAWGIDAVEEQKKQFNEQRIFAEESAKFQEDMAQKQMMTDMMTSGGQPGMAPGMTGMPAGGGGQQAITPQDLMTQAEELAMQWVSMPYEQRRTAMSDVKQSNETLWALAKGKMQQIRQDASSQGQQAMMQEAQGGGGPAM